MSAELIEACKYGDIHAVEFVINIGVNLDFQDEHGCTALMYACKFKRIKAAQFLINKGANIDLQNNSGKTALDIIKATDELSVLFKC